MQAPEDRDFSFFLVFLKRIVCTYPGELSQLSGHRIPSRAVRETSCMQQSLSCCIHYLTLTRIKWTKQNILF